MQYGVQAYELQEYLAHVYTYYTSDLHNLFIYIFIHLFIYFLGIIRSSSHWRSGLQILIIRTTSIQLKPKENSCYFSCYYQWEGQK